MALGVSKAMGTALALIGGAIGMGIVAYALLGSPLDRAREAEDRAASVAETPAPVASATDDSQDTGTAPTVSTEETPEPSGTDTATGAVEQTETADTTDTPPTPAPASEVTETAQDDTPAAEEVATEDTATDNTAPEDTASEDTASKDAASDDTVSDDMVSDDMAADESETAPETETETAETAPTPEEPAQTQTTIVETTPAPTPTQPPSPETEVEVTSEDNTVAPSAPEREVAESEVVIAPPTEEGDDAQAMVDEATEAEEAEPAQEATEVTETENTEPAQETTVADATAPRVATGDIATPATPAASPAPETRVAEDSPDGTGFFAAPDAPGSADLLALGPAPTAAPPADVPEIDADDPAVPTFDLVRVDTDGAAVIAGRALPNAEVRILSDGQELARTVASARGEFVALVDADVQQSTQVIRLQARLDEGPLVDSAESVIVLGRSGEAGTETASDATNTDDGTATTTETRDAALSEDEQTPAPPTVLATGRTGLRVLQPGGLATADRITLDTISYDAKGQVVLAGRGRPGNTARIYINRTPMIDVPLSEGGSWQATLVDVDEGRYTLRVDEVRPDGSVASRAESPFQRVYPSAERLALLMSDTQVIVQPGNNLWRIAERRYGEGMQYWLIYRANKGQIRDPDLIYPGQIFDLPEQ